ncbi:MAG: PEP-CTERM sorting domain-containing protein [Candidatus Omnitrophica bacterium]|nr:PEP-CTERM sorting domain-containing protein [Candidatus Omnitrophota bacterium]MBI3010823.1 PEP-CTERM sorting domain-containing protein [Candidatus Omnitrophota bacterium]
MFILVTASLAMSLVSGCGGSGGGLSSLFGSGDSVDVVSSAFSGGSSSDSGLGSFGAGGSFSEGVAGLTDGSLGDSSGSAVATVHQPEPASMVLFSGGLMGAAYLRRRRQKNRSL